MKIKRFPKFHCCFFVDESAKCKSIKGKRGEVGGGVGGKAWHTQSSKQIVFFTFFCSIFFSTHTIYRILKATLTFNM